MSVWICEKCGNLQGFTKAMQCGCGGKLQFANLSPQPAAPVPASGPRPLNYPDLKYTVPNEAPGTCAICFKTFTAGSQVYRDNAPGSFRCLSHGPASSPEPRDGMTDLLATLDELFPLQDAERGMDRSRRMVAALTRWMEDENRIAAQSVGLTGVIRRALQALQGSRLLVWPWVKGGAITEERWHQACLDIDVSIDELLKLSVATEVKNEHR